MIMKKTSREDFHLQLTKILRPAIATGDGNFITLSNEKSLFENQNQTNEVFSEKWSEFEKESDKNKFYQMQKHWYLELYGFSSESNLSDFLKSKKVIFDAGCGLGYKAAWFAQLAPDSLVIGMDYSDAAQIAAEIYTDLPNLFFIKGDIADTAFLDGSINYVSCDQVIQHTQNPEQTFAELTRITSAVGEFACYFYAKKALPRELLDDYFRIHCKNMDNAQLWDLSKQLTELGKQLSNLKVSFQCPEIPALGIKAGEYDIQRFIYWNFLKCYFNEEIGQASSEMINFDWYSPSNAKRFSEEEINNLLLVNKMGIVHFHREDACFSGRFQKAA